MLSTSIGADVEAGSTNGATTGSVSIVGSWTGGPASTGAGAADSQVARLPDNGGVVELCSTAVVGFQGDPAVARMVLRALLAGVLLCVPWAMWLKCMLHLQQ